MKALIASLFLRGICSVNRTGYGITEKMRVDSVVVPLQVSKNKKLVLAKLAGCCCPATVPTVWHG
jgi:hypothetical protein